MTKNDHLAKAKDYIAIAEAGDSRQEAYAKAADEIADWLASGNGRTLQQAADAVGKHKSFVSRLLSARNNGTAPDWASGSNKRDEVAAKVLRDPAQRSEVIRALDTEQVEAIMHAATSELGQRERRVPQTRPAAKSLFQRFADHCFAGWKLQDETQDTPPPVGEELARFRAVADGNLAFAQAIVHWLDTGDFDAEVAQLLAEVQA